MKQTNNELVQKLNESDLRGNFERLEKENAKLREENSIWRSFGKMLSEMFCEKFAKNFERNPF